MIENLSRWYYNQGLLRARSDEISVAVRYLAKAVSYDSTNLEAWNLAGLCYYRLGSFKTAEFCWARSVSLCGEGNPATGYLSDLRNALAESAPHFSAVTVLCERGEYARAAAVVEAELCTRLGESAALLNYLGILYALGRKTSAALRCWTNALSVDKDNPDTARYLAAMQRRLSYKLLKLKDRLLNRKVVTDK
ncbi:MAG: hypothetical protein AB1497_01570 [Bacillota bacterium]